jgi:hypothetical protein
MRPGMGTILCQAPRRHQAFVNARERIVIPVSSQNQSFNLLADAMGDLLSLWDVKHVIERVSR